MYIYVFKIRKRYIKHLIVYILVYLNSYQKFISYTTLINIYDEF